MKEMVSLQGSWEFNIIETDGWPKPNLLRKVQLADQDGQVMRRLEAVRRRVSQPLNPRFSS